MGHAIPAGPLLWSLELGANLGGNITLVGAAANVVVASLVEINGYPISFKHFLRYGVITLVMPLALASGYVWMRYL
jgi:Na+/H+ antiporter NhaD/arsenite permease-like protein